MEKHDFEKVMDILFEKIDKIQKDVDELKMLFAENKESCEKMTTHIDFVNETYEKFKHPLNVIKDMVSWRKMLGN
jgi:peptidoglycan hydrolase CwlO-like protein